MKTDSEKTFEELQTELVESLEQDQLDCWNRGEMTCESIRHEDKEPVKATHRVKRETYHEDEHGNAIDDIWHQYFCDQCYKEEFTDNGEEPEIVERKLNP